MSSRKLLQQVRILDPNTQIEQVGDILIEDGIIQEISPKVDLSAEDSEGSIEIIDGTGLVVAPALVDIFCSSGTPGYEERETLESLAAAARAGGVSRVAILPDTNPPVDNPNTVTWLKKQTDSLPLRCYIWGALTDSLGGKNIAQLADLASAGVVGFTDNRPHDNLQLVRRLLEYGRMFQLPIALSPTQLHLRGDGVARESRTSVRLGLTGSPFIAETVAIASLLEIVSFTGTPIHLMRISTQKGVELIRRAKEENLPVTASVNWHHLLLNIEVVASYDPNLRFEPPLGTEDDRLALIEGVKSGIIDAIAIDHTPYTIEEKNVGFAAAPPGAIGLELALPLLWQNLVDTGYLSAIQLWRALSVNPLRCLNQKPVKLARGEEAELVIFSPQSRWQVTASSLKSLSSNTYWLDKEIKGRVIALLSCSKNP
ncbi:MAG: dihydroorotase [Geminocystis sp.]|nr:dihydroorotase [Geminocystis sp.]HIK37144.1 dihydroorotase [Geminocystis sp. M7585_C2015_104]MCS7147486.1 dihydroorotase [Geminocystis sp.]MCX8077889.1 dihydroorotase [Geminocystis sp.]MDW8115179.1 dihydroorotase [Geminocystis sp.]